MDFKPNLSLLAYKERAFNLQKTKWSGALQLRQPVSRA